MRRGVVAALITLILVIPSLALIYTQRVSQPIDAEIDENGIAMVKIVVEVDEGVSGVVLPIEPIPLTIEITPSVPGVEWLYENNTLYIVSPKKTTFTVTYIANTTIENGVISIKVETNNTVKLVLAPNILLLTLPENIINISTLPGNKLEIIFTGPTIISYTITQITPTATPTTTPISTLITSPTPTPKSTTPIVIISTPSPTQTTSTQTPRTPTPATPSIITSTPPIQSLTTPVPIATTISTLTTPTTPTTTLPQALSTPKVTAIPIDIVVIAIMIIIIIVAIILALRRR
jgi:hypothetical protein